MEIPEGAENLLLAFNAFYCVKLHMLEIFCGLSWGKQFAAFIVALCQPGISNGSFTVPPFHNFFSLTKIVLSSFFDVPYNATFYSPALCCSN